MCVCVKLPGVILQSFANSQVVWKLCGSGVTGIAFLWEKAFQRSWVNFFLQAVELHIKGRAYASFPHT